MNTYNVILYPTVWVKIEGVEAFSPRQAVCQAIDRFWPPAADYAFKLGGYAGEFAEGVTSALVDAVGDEEHEHTVAVDLEEVDPHGLRPFVENIARMEVYEEDEIDHSDRIEDALHTVNWIIRRAKELSNCDSVAKAAAESPAEALDTALEALRAIAAIQYDGDDSGGGEADVSNDETHDRLVSAVETAREALKDIVRRRNEQGSY
jgi:hypothetical protein